MEKKAKSQYVKANDKRRVNKINSSAKSDKQELIFDIRMIAMSQIVQD